MTTATVYMCRKCFTYDQTETESLDTVADDVDHAISLSLLPGWSDVVGILYADLADLVLATAELAHVRATGFDCATTWCVSKATGTVPGRAQEVLRRTRRESGASGEAPGTRHHHAPGGSC